MTENRLIFALILLSRTVHGLTGNEENREKFLLPGDLRVTHYNVHLITRIDEFELGNESSFKFDVEMQMFMTVVNINVTEIVTNSERLTTVRGAVLHRSGFDPVNLGTGNYNSTTEKLTFPLPTVLRKEEVIRLDVNATVQQNDFVGFVYDFYYGKNGTKRWFVYTDLEPANARLIFPCFDEPKYKATYNVSVSVPKNLVNEGYYALSNAAESRREEAGKYAVIHFEKTAIPMSSYLFAVFVGDFVSTEPLFFNRSRPRPQRGVLKTWGKSEEMEIYGGSFPQSVAFALIKIYTEDFGIGYDFGKIDQVILHGYPMAMENWGLIWYKGDLLSGYSEDSARIIAHELSHQWFGNLVTLHWWSDVWLNEGFASYFEYFGADKINEDGINGKHWNLPYHFVIEMVQYVAMYMDVPEAFNHPLTVEVYDPNEYSQYFSTFIYGKGSSIIYMWRNVFGEKAFGKVLRHYLRSFQFGVATPEALLDCFDRFANESESDLRGMKPSKFLRNWHVKSGVPIVSVRKAEDNPFGYVLSQDVFRMQKETVVESAEWTIPISYSTSEYINFDDRKAEFWLAPGKNLTLELGKPVKWIIVNNQESGYYRVNYNVENWKALFKVLNETNEEIHELNRAQIMDDSHEIARSTAFDYLEYDLVLDMMSYLRREQSYFPWKSAFNKLEFLKRMMSKNESVYPLFRIFVLDLVTNRVEISWSAQIKCDPDEKNKFEKLVISWACEMGHSSCSSESKRLLKERNKLCSDSLQLAYCSYIRSNSDSLTWEKVWNDYVKTEDEGVKRSIRRSLGCSKNRILLNRLLEKSISQKSGLSRTERGEIVSSVLGGNVENVKILLRFLQENLREFLTALNRKYIEWDLFVDIGERLATDEELSRMGEIMIGLGELSKMDGKGIRKWKMGKMLEKAIGIVRANNEWQKIRSKSVSDWLLSRYSSRTLP